MIFLLVLPVGDMQPILAFQYLQEDMMTGAVYQWYKN